MGLGYLLPGQEQWNPRGTWAARLPSALSCCAVMLLLADTLWRWPQPAVPGRKRNPAQPGPAALAAAATAPLAFALSPLALLWGRTAVSDALLCGLVAASFCSAGAPMWCPRDAGGPPGSCSAWRCSPRGPSPWCCWASPCWVSAGCRPICADWRGVLRPVRGLALTALVSLPWYGAALRAKGTVLGQFLRLSQPPAVHRRGERPPPALVVLRGPFWWWPSLPVTPLLLLGLVRSVPFHLAAEGRSRFPPEYSLSRFAACWLLAVLLFFTLAATKLPSYWLPATPAAVC